MRVAEILTDFHSLLYNLVHIQANPTPEDYYLEGYQLLRACVAEAQAALASPYFYSPSQNPNGDAEVEKAQQLRA